jgi:DNA integrity scanning protein DisA with diadenylate cyclase activity
MFEALQRLAQLAAIDGALIIDSNFKVVAFGAKLTAPAWDKKTVIGPDGYGSPNGQPFEINRYGTRHQSARDFAAACESAIVFVISQDGPIRAFHRTDETTVTCWPDCTTSMFVDH